MADPGIYIPNQTATAWLQLGKGALPVDTTPPTVPGGLSATATSSSITLTWTASTDTETGVGGYDVSIDSGAFVTLPASQLSYTFNGLAASSAHTVSVRARDNAATPNTSASASVNKSTLAAPVTTPRNLRTTASTTTSLTFAWDAPASLPAGATLTRYEYRLGQAGGYTSNGTATTKQLTGLTQDTPYTFGVRAVFSDSTVSSEVTLTARTTATSGGTGTMYIGTHLKTPTATDISNNPELSIYSGLSTVQTLQARDAEYRSLTGFTENPLMSIGHAFHAPGSNYRLSSEATSVMALFPAMILNFKPTRSSDLAGCQQTANGTDDAAIIAMVNSLPANKRIYVTYFHEPPDPLNDATDAFIVAWRAAFARFAKLVIQNRGSKDVHPMICWTAWSFRSAASARQALYLQVEDDLTAAGIDWRTQVVMGPDGYGDKAAGSAYQPSAVFAPVYPVLKARGWQRFGLTETATASKAGTIGSKTATAADVAASPQWTKDLVKYALSFNLEYICWFDITGAWPPVGAWQYTSAIKTVWGQAAHYKGPAPGW